MVGAPGLRRQIFGPRFPWGRAATCLLVLAVTSLPWRPDGELAAGEQPRTTLELRDHDRLVWIGGTFVERMQQDNYLETLLCVAYPEKKLTFRNLGWSGDTVDGASRGVFGGPNEGFARLVKDTKEARPTLLFIQYGANEAQGGPAGVAPFVNGLNRLLSALGPLEARVVLVSPYPREKLPAPLPDPARYNEHLPLYEAALRKFAEERNCAFVSLADLYQAIPAPWSAPPAGFQFTENSLHFHPLGAYLTATAIATKLGVKFEPWRATIDAKRLQAESSGVSVTDLKRTETGLTLMVADRWGPLPLPPASRFSGDKTLFQGEARIAIKGLLPGKYRLQAEGQPVATLSDQEWALGSTALSPARSERAENLRAVIQAKNELYFHRYRPQNETYLFLFRKHEQGKNAVEIPQFDPLVADKEKLIFELSQPLRQRLELSRVE